MAYQLYSFTNKIASRGYHVYMHTTWEKAQVDDNVVVKIETDVNSKMIDPYCCKILTKNEEQRLVTVGHIPREISRYVFFFLRDEGAQCTGNSLQYNIAHPPFQQED